MSCSCSGVAKGHTSPTRLRNARVVLAFSATQWRSRAAAVSAPMGMTSRKSGMLPPSCEGAMQPKSRVLGMRIRRPFRGASARVGSWGMSDFLDGQPGEGIQPRLAQQLAGQNQRQADQRCGVIRLDAGQQADAQAFTFGAAGAVIGLLQLQIGFDLGVAERLE